MNWSDNIRHQLELGINDITVNKSIKNSASVRKRLLRKYNTTCGYCGGIFKKYLIVTKIDQVEDIICHGCYIITNLNMGYCDEMEIYYSELIQFNITKNSIDYIAQNNKIPHPSEIDKDCKKVNLSVMELCNLLVINKTLPKYMKNYKIFFSQKFNKFYIDENSERILFLNDSDDEDNDKIENTYNDTFHKFSKNELNFIKNNLLVK